MKLHKVKSSKSIWVMIKRSQKQRTKLNFDENQTLKLKWHHFEEEEEKTTTKKNR